MAKDPNRPNPDESPNRQEPEPQPKPEPDSGYSSERAPHGDGDIETDRGEPGRRNESIE